MSLLVLDEHLPIKEVVEPLGKHYSVVRVPDLRPKQQVLDDRIPEVLLELDRPTFVTIDRDFWDRSLCHAAYCLLYFDLRSDEQRDLPEMLRSLFRHDEFATRAARMGKVARIDQQIVEYWQPGSQTRRRLE